jgi:hypothetical protein
MARVQLQAVLVQVSVRGEPPSPRIPLNSRTVRVAAWYAIAAPIRAGGLASVTHGDAVADRLGLEVAAAPRFAGPQLESSATALIHKISG